MDDKCGIVHGMRFVPIGNENTRVGTGTITRSCRYSSLVEIGSQLVTHGAAPKFFFFYNRYEYLLKRTIDFSVTLVVLTLPASKFDLDWSVYKSNRIYTRIRVASLA